jgi:hypothetical protein
MAVLAVLVWQSVVTSCLSIVSALDVDRALWITTHGGAGPQFSFNSETGNRIWVKSRSSPSLRSANKSSSGPSPVPSRDTVANDAAGTCLADPSEHPATPTRVDQRSVNETEDAHLHRSRYFGIRSDFKQCRGSDQFSSLTFSASLSVISTPIRTA